MIDPHQNCQPKPNCVDLQVIDDVTGQVKVKVIDLWNMFTLWALTVA